MTASTAAPRTLAPQLSHKEALLLACLLPGGPMKAANVRHKFTLTGVVLETNTFCAIAKRAEKRGMLTRQHGRYQITDRGREALERTQRWYEVVNEKCGKFSK